MLVEGYVSLPMATALSPDTASVAVSTCMYVCMCFRDGQTT